jgi:hypothetical protein
MQSKRQITRTARRLFRLCVVGGTLDEARVRQVVQGTIASKRRGVTVLLTRFERLVRPDRERHSAVVESATPLSTRCARTSWPASRECTARASRRRLPTTRRSSAVCA